MPLPEWSADGLLPPRVELGGHAATFDELYERCVVGAPHTARRAKLFDALSFYCGLMTTVVPAGILWIDGGFTTAKAASPADVDVVVFPDDWDSVLELDDVGKRRLKGLLTLQDVIVGFPLLEGWDRIQPLGGELDGFLGRPSDRAIWHATWSRVKLPDGTIDQSRLKGYVEVSL